VSWYMDKFERTSVSMPGEFEANTRSRSALKHRRIRDLGVLGRILGMGVQYENIEVSRKGLERADDFLYVAEWNGNASISGSGLLDDTLF
jgi:hypothetical protein